jgi:hypothetical protein
MLQAGAIAPMCARDKVALDARHGAFLGAMRKSTAPKQARKGHLAVCREATAEDFAGYFLQRFALIRTLLPE